jgi:hypothetical protein
LRLGELYRAQDSAATASTPIDDTSRAAERRYTQRQGGPIPMDAAMPDTISIAAGRERQEVFWNRHRTPSSGIAAAHQTTISSGLKWPADQARPSNHHGRCFRLSKH